MVRISLTVGVVNQPWQSPGRLKNLSYYIAPVGDRTHDLPHCHTVASNMVNVSHALNHSATAAVKSMLVVVAASELLRRTNLGADTTLVCLLHCISPVFNLSFSVTRARYDTMRFAKYAEKHLCGVQS